MVVTDKNSLGLFYDDELIWYGIRHTGITYRCERYGFYSINVVDHFFWQVRHNMHLRL